MIKDRNQFLASAARPQSRRRIISTMHHRASQSHRSATTVPRTAIIALRRLAFVAIAACTAIGGWATVGFAETPQPEPVTASKAGSATEPSTAPGAESRAAPAAESGAPNEATAADAPVDFRTDIEPIFFTHCLECHGPEKRKGGLRLDELMYAQSGGDSGQPILGGTLETNELYRRVSSKDRRNRMPKNADPLAAEELERIERWVKQGTPWPNATRKKTMADETLYGRTLEWANRLFDRVQFEYDLIRPYFVVLLLALIAMLVVSRAKAAYAADRPWTRGRLRGLCRFASGVTTRDQAFVFLLLCAGSGLTMMRAHQQKLNQHIAKLQKGFDAAQSRFANTVYGFPPVPIRPDEPKQLARTYYRGNCERNPELFNGGNYLTATFHIRMCDAQDRTLDVGDAPSEGMYLRIELVRAPGTPDDLFSKGMIDSVFLSEKYYEANSSELADLPIRLETLEEGQRWLARCPIEPPTAAKPAGGLIYLYTGRIEKGIARGDAHYGIRYDLDCKNGKLTADSNVWMGSFANAVVATPSPPGRIPYREWFDFHPIPAITGENSKDPKLLGIEEYVRKGLIPPRPPPQSDE